jgi:glutamate dehydrogenase (NAD(P)+)
MTLIMDTYQSIYGHRDINAAAVTTGKSIVHMGIRGRTESTGLGVYYATKQILADAHQAQKLGI